MISTARESHRVLLVDDDEVLPLSIISYSQRFQLSLEYDYAKNVEQAIEFLNHVCYDAAILDVRLPGITGVTLGGLVRERDVNLPIAYLTNLDTSAVREEAIHQRAYILSKLNYVGSDKGIAELVTIIYELAQLNPCIRDGVRINNHGYARELPKTPIELPDSLMGLLRYSKSIATAA